MASLEAEADPPLVIDPDAPLPFAIMPQRLQPVRWREAQVFERRRRVKLEQPHPRAGQDGRREAARESRGEEALRFRGTEGTNHRRRI